MWQSAATLIGFIILYHISPPRLELLLSVLPHRINTAHNEKKIVIKMENIALYMYTVNDTAELRQVDVSEVFSKSRSNTTVYTPNITLHLHNLTEIGKFFYVYFSSIEYI